MKLFSDCFSINLGVEIDNFYYVILEFPAINKSLPYLGVLLITLHLYGCNSKANDETDIVQNVIYKLIEADNRSDLDAILNSYTDSIEFYPAGKEFMKGIAEIKTNYEKLFRENKLVLTTLITDTKVMGDNAIVTGINKGHKKSLTDSTIASIDDKYIALLVRNNKGEWKIDKLIWGINH